ncbi:formylglycine-generating enzyme family protein [Pedobacter insulae]|uniref:Formylglycine-generating enzyme, required for sulfatase activity, contains SUMF1/FGE domain n=1 Tax=Pedobacter insulae TaxID=414048 RepID=A0A1I2TJG0_9SPHI|nr:SUMF1/EgtB/PvdO family nonheme iron enzyme [Pedobacter insulae]SFG65052.1 Formylglycine-generating enzyme, required for sulfatase activity, contains SUMF1/FGE domain [Pedobacter insulae]
MNRKFQITMLCLLLVGIHSKAQEKFSTYSQNIEGTKVSYEMVPIPGGSFLMGSENGNSDEQPVHKVELDPFWMGKMEVTWDLFELFLYKDYEVSQSTKAISSAVDAVTRPTKPYLDMTFGMGKQNHPALAMTQYNAIQFCKWLYARTGMFYRLPTEAEWEYACKAGTNGDFYFGNDKKELASYAWYSENSDKKTHPVGQKKPNTWGLYDMHGNVAEWTYDQYLPAFYAEGAGKEVKNPVANPEKLYPLVVRGGAFDDEAKDLRAAAREASDPAWKQIDPQIPKSNWWFPEAPFIGVRLVRPLNTPSKEQIEAYYNKAPIKDY